MLVPLVHGTGATLPDAISPSAKLAASAVPGTHTGHLTRKGNPFTAPAGKAAVPQKADAHPEAEIMDAA